MLVHQATSISRCAAIERPILPSSVRRPCKTRALFGWGSKDTGEVSDREAAKQDQIRVQQELLAARRNGSQITEANERRRKVQADLQAKKSARKDERDSLAQGIMPDSLKDWKNYKTKSDEKGTEGLIVPLLPFGRVDYDEGERFDLRSPYSDDGWVDPDETDVWGSIRNIGSKLFPSMMKKQDVIGSGEVGPDGKRKGIIWASNYGQYQQEQKLKAQKAAEEKQQKKRKGK